jgi:hypothetical protein
MPLASSPLYRFIHFTAAESLDRPIPSFYLIEPRSFHFYGREGKKEKKKGRKKNVRIACVKRLPNANWPLKYLCTRNDCR